MPKLPKGGASDGSDQDDPKNVDALERLRAKLARLNRDAEQLAEAMRRKKSATRAGFLS
jgi:hypothetical protein